MSWAKFDDRYDDNRKVKRAWRAHPRAVGLHAMAVTYSARHETDGIIDIEWVEDRLPSKVEREKCLVALLGAGLFERVDDQHFRIHDYLDYQEPAAVLSARRVEERERKRAAGRKGAEARWNKPPSGSATSEPNSSADSSRMPGAMADAKASMAPDPTRPDPSTSEHETATNGLHVSEVEPSRLDAAKERMKAGEDGARLCSLLAELIQQRDPKAKVAPESARWLRDMRLLVADRGDDVAEVERVLRWSQADAFWQANILSPGKLREKFTALRSKMLGGSAAVESGRRSLSAAELQERRDRAERESLARLGAAR